MQYIKYKTPIAVILQIPYDYIANINIKDKKQFEFLKKGDKK